MTVSGRIGAMMSRRGGGGGEGAKNISGARDEWSRASSFTVAVKLTCPARAPSPTPAPAPPRAADVNRERVISPSAPFASRNFL